VGFQTNDIYFLLQMYPDPNTLLRNDNDTVVNENRGRGANISASYSGGASKTPILHLIQIPQIKFNQNMLRNFGDETFGRTGWQKWVLRYMFASWRTSSDNLLISNCPKQHSTLILFTSKQRESRLYITKRLDWKSTGTHRVNKQFS
jgi:hypothetical protein